MLGHRYSVFVCQSCLPVDLGCFTQKFRDFRHLEGMVEVIQLFSHMFVPSF